MLPSPSSSVCTRWFFLNRANVRESTDLSMVMIRVSSSRIDCGPSPSARAFTMTILLAVGPIPCRCSKSLHIFASIYNFCFASFACLVDRRSNRKLEVVIRHLSSISTAESGITPFIFLYLLNYYINV